LPPPPAKASQTERLLQKQKRTVLIKEDGSLLFLFVKALEEERVWERGNFS
jgi:hypothetical protein